MTQGKFIMAPGGWPIRGAGGVTIGAIGISGGNAPGRDDEIARVGVQAAELALQSYYQQRAQAQQPAALPSAAPAPTPIPITPAAPQSVHLPQAAPPTAELPDQEPGASVYTPLQLIPEPTSPAPSEAPDNDLDNMPTMTVSSEQQPE